MGRKDETERYLSGKPKDKSMPLNYAIIDFFCSRQSNKIVSVVTEEKNEKLNMIGGSHAIRAINHIAGFISQGIPFVSVISNCHTSTELNLLHKFVYLEEKLSRQRAALNN